MSDPNTIDDRALDSMSVAPGDVEKGDKRDVHDERQNAGQDKSIARRLEKHPDSSDARLDNALDESMDASDPPSSTQPIHSTEPPASSGYDADAEQRRDR